MSGPLTATALQLGCRAEQDLWLANPWSDFHGGFGLMLKAHWPAVFDEWMGGRDREAAVRPYVLSHRLPLGPATGAGEQVPRPDALPVPTVLAGETFGLSLTLFGASARLWAAGCDALARLGSNGLTSERQHFAVESIDARYSLQQAETVRLWVQGEWLLDHPPAMAVQAFAGAGQSTPCLLQLRYASPLQIKLGNTLSNEAPPLGALVDRGLARLSMLAHHAGREAPVSREQRDEVVAALQGAACVNGDASLQRWDRYSRRQGQNIPSPGIVGEQVWHLDAGAAGALRPWADALQLAHLGSKTSMGFGAVQMQFASAHG